MRPFTTSLQLFVVRAGGGRWPFELQLDSTEPEVDDSIVIEAALKTTATVSFKLVNRFEAFSPFQVPSQTIVLNYLSRSFMSSFEVTLPGFLNCFFFGCPRPSSRRTHR